MAARWTAVTLALFITGAPVVTTVCEGVCAAREHERGTTATHHSCHQQASTITETAITAAAHICGHSDEGPSAVGQSLWLLAAPAVVVDTFTFVPPSLGAPRCDRGSDHGPPLFSPRSTQLRI